MKGADMLALLCLVVATGAICYVAARTLAAAPRVAVATWRALPYVPGALAYMAREHWRGLLWLAGGVWLCASYPDAGLTVALAGGFFCAPFALSAALCYWLD